MKSTILFLLLSIFNNMIFQYIYVLKQTLSSLPIYYNNIVSYNTISNNYIKMWTCANIIMSLQKKWQNNNKRWLIPRDLVLNVSPKLQIYLLSYCISVWTSRRTRRHTTLPTVKYWKCFTKRKTNLIRNQVTWVYIVELDMVVTMVQDRRTINSYDFSFSVSRINR